MTSVAPTVKLAVLIDGDNASPYMTSYILAEIAKYGTAFVKRAYADWTTPSLSPWRDQMLENSIQPIQQFAYTKGKNSTDSAMIIDAMDLLYSNKFDGFCIVSSDSDFTRLASRIRESGLLVYGCGERKTPKPFVTACDKFIYVENLIPRTGTATPEPTIPAPTNGATGGPDALSKFYVPARPIAGSSTAARSSQPTSDPPPNKRKRIESDNDLLLDYKPSSRTNNTNLSPTDTPTPLKVTSREMEWLREAVRAASDEDGWVRLADVGNLLIKWHPDFDSRSYGFEKLGGLIESLPAFDVERRIVTQGRPPIVYVRVKPQPQTRPSDAEQDVPGPKTLFSYEALG